MTSLEMRYRRLLRAYPSGHRATYGEEMIGVLMSGSEPGRRFPTPADAIDLLRAGLTARLGRAFHLQRGTGWRDAAAVTGLFAALLLSGVAINRLVIGLMLWAGGDPMQWRGVDGLMLVDPALRSVTWPLLVVAAVLGLRRAAVWIAGAGVLAQVAALPFWSAPGPVRYFVPTWTLAMAVVTFALFAAAAPARTPRAVLRRPAGTLGRIVVLSAVLGVVWTVFQRPGPAEVSFDFIGMLLAPIVVLVAGMVALRVGERLTGRGHGHVRAHE
jgi:hypothetical protein